MSYVRKKPPKGTGSGQAFEMDGGSFGQDYPALWEYLSLDRWPEGGARKTATLTVFVEEGQVKLCLNDRDQQQSGWCSGSSVQDALQSLERHLVDERVEWRRARGQSGRGR